MGRMLDTLKQGEGRRVPIAISKPAGDAPVLDCVTDWEIAEEVPFVEVGGPNKKVELSPGLMKHAAQASPSAFGGPHLPREKPSVASKPLAVNLTPTKPMAAAFEPWPGATPTPLGISAEIIAYHQPDHAATKEYALLLQTLRGGLKAVGPNVLLLVGLKPHVGASTVLLNLAVIAAREQKTRVLLVDANSQRASLSQRLGLGACAGLLDVIEGTLALEQSIVKTGIAALHLLPAGTPSKTPRPLGAEAMAWLINWLRERYDLVFIDGPTIENAADLAVQVPHADGIYLVLPQGETASVNKGIAQTISRLGGRLCGLIHTHFEV